METEVKNNIIFFISSVIYFGDSPLNYHQTRSVFTPKEREVQTQKTIKSIKSAIPNAKIVMVESGLREGIDQEIINLIDEYIYTGDMKMVRRACDGQKKGLGEATSLYYGLKRVDSSGYKYIFKISGRYFLNDNFSLDNYDFNSDFSFRFYDNPKQVSTRLYGFKGDRFAEWLKILRSSFPALYMNKSIEEILYIKTKSLHCSRVAKLGISGLVGPNGDKINE